MVVRVRYDQASVCANGEAAISMFMGLASGCLQLFLSVQNS